MITFFDLTVHLYGLFVGLGAVIAYMIIEKIGKKDGFDESQILKMAASMFLGALIGARAWHVWTDWHLYADQPLAAVAIWNGGLSILGAFAGGALFLFFMHRWQVTAHKHSDEKVISLAHFADLIAFGAPIGQMVGRLGNAFNQELYGSPTNFPWKIYIAPENRFENYLDAAFYHPLFAYEILLLGLFVLGYFYLERSGIWERGKGNFAIAYAFCYAIVRFALDFLRVDKVFFAESALGLNQVVLLIFICVLSVVILYRKKRSV